MEFPILYLAAILTVLLLTCANMGYSTPSKLTTGVVAFVPWSILDRLSSLVIGYSVNDFQFVVGETPMSTLRGSILAIALYYTIIFGGQQLMRSRPAFKVDNVFIFHNLCMTLISGALLALFVEQLAPILRARGFLEAICGKSGWTQHLVLLYYLNYLTKYLELLDTVFLVLKKKPLTFLHTYHHGATAALCYVQRTELRIWTMFVSMLT